MTGTAPSELRSRMMRAVRSKNTTPELKLRRLLHRAGFRFRLHRKDLPGSPDLAFPSRKAVIFVHGCFWHGHDCKRGARAPKSNADYWRAKIARNVERDGRSLDGLQAAGWRAATVWECELKDADAVLARVTLFLGGSPMRKVQNFGDDRNKGSCVHCGGPNETVDHAPSVVLLDAPLPPDLPTSPSCAACNQGFSNDEAYLACLLECVVAGSADPAKIGREKIAALIRRRPSLAAELAALRREEGGRIAFSFDRQRVENVIVKLARCHVAYEINEPRTDEPDSVWFTPLEAMTEVQRQEFEDGGDDLAVWPEVGSRAMQRLLIVDDDAFGEGWLDVQPGRYRFRTSVDDGLRVRMVIRGYLACEVRWD
ncbi:very short patch repair endonuclease [Allosphingosinicella humi]